MVSVDRSVCSYVCTDLLSTRDYMYIILAKMLSRNKNNNNILFLACMNSAFYYTPKELGEK